jgi:hypothetical protein
MTKTISSPVSTPSPDKNYTSLLLLLSLLIVAILLLLFLRVRLLSSKTHRSSSSSLIELPFSPKTKTKTTPAISSAPPSPTPTIVPSPTGKFTYKVMTGIKTGPLFQDITLDPYDPAPNSTQTFTVQINSQKPVTKAQMTLVTDHQNRTQSLSLIKGTATNGTYQASFPCIDSYNYTYKIRFEAQDDSGQSNQNEVILR